MTGELWLVNEIFLSARNNLIGRLCAFMRVGNPPCGFVLYFYRGTQDYIFSFAAKISFMSYKSPVLLRVFSGLQIIRNNQLSSAYYIKSQNNEKLKNILRICWQCISLHFIAFCCIFFITRKGFNFSWMNKTYLKFLCKVFMAILFCIIITNLQSNL